MKSRRCASSPQSSVKATTARRPSVATSRRRVVISKGLPPRDRRHRAVLDAGRHGLQPRGLQRRGHLVRRQRGGDVDVADRLAEQGVAHAAADDSARNRPRPPPPGRPSPPPSPARSSRGAGRSSRSFRAVFWGRGGAVSKWPLRHRAAGGHLARHIALMPVVGVEDRGRRPATGRPAPRPPPPARPRASSPSRGPSAAAQARQTNQTANGGSTRLPANEEDPKQRRLHRAGRRARAACPPSRPR